MDDIITTIIAIIYVIIINIYHHHHQNKCNKLVKKSIHIYLIINIITKIFMIDIHLDQEVVSFVLSSIVVLKTVHG